MDRTAGKLPTHCGVEACTQAVFMAYPGPHEHAISLCADLLF